jgi:capsular polysaccharide biosynthesis protein
MELCLYWHIVRKRIGIILALIGVVLVSYWALRPPVSTSYVAHMRFVVGVRPEPASAEYYRYDRYYTWLTAEYLVDDLAEVVKSKAFAGDVATLSGLDVPGGAIQGATSAGKLHRILQVSITWHDPEQLERIANAVVETLQTRGHVYFAQLATDEATLAVIDPPAISPVGASLRQRLDLPLRLILALAAGIGLAFLADYVDDSVRSRSDLIALGLTVLGEIPGRRQGLFRRVRRAV